MAAARRLLLVRRREFLEGNRDMHILVSGKHGSPIKSVGEMLKSKWGRLGTAVYVHDAKGPIYLLRDALHTVSRQFGPVPGLDAEDIFLQQALLDWAREGDVQYWGKAARRAVDEVTGRWEELGLFHVAVIQNLCFREDYELFPRAYRVFLMPPKDYKPHLIYCHHESETSLDQWAADSARTSFSVFDLVLKGGEGDAETIAEAIFSGFNERFKSGFRTLN